MTPYTHLANFMHLKGKGAPGVLLHSDSRSVTGLPLAWHTGPWLGPQPFPGAKQGPFLPEEEKLLGSHAGLCLKRARGSALAGPISRAHGSALGPPTLLKGAASCILTEEAAGQCGRPPPIVCEQDQHGLLAGVVIPARGKLHGTRVQGRPAKALHHHQQTLVAALFCHPVTDLEESIWASAEADCLHPAGLE